MMNQWILQEQRFNRFSSGLCTKGTSAVQNCSASKGPSIISSLSFQFLSRQTDRRQKSEGLEKWWFEAYCWQRCPEIHQEVVHQLLSSTRPEYVSYTGITGKHKLGTTVRMLKLGTRAKQQTSHYTASAVNDPCLNVLHVERFLTAESRNEVVILTSPYSPKLNWNAEQLPSNYPFSSTIHTNFRFFSVLSLVDHQIFRHKEIIPQKTEICCPGQSQLAWRLCMKIAIKSPHWFHRKEGEEVFISCLSLSLQIVTRHINICLPLTHPNLPSVWMISCEICHLCCLLSRCNSSILRLCFIS